ncbi:hypothetical protein [Candidatus Galacturonibacter soehngenii]|uniref:Adenosine deaminase domain-containing protein n=1 Tax=Candidatus Galacturonatibacter soehngenii TaxID=2307010 RepID=A0A7V7UC21_9FIRM|nr:hypothetical protein [Candidatus Galacturonibacter soehngenii]KAB1438500.1 hypothetical protein F7O84_13250 [Candidatus Galacturonibacter soehngenii]
MLKHITDTTVKASILPFSDERFLKEDIFNKIYLSQNPYTEYREFVEKTYSYIRQTHHIDNLDYIQLLIEKYYPLRLLRNYDSNSIFQNQLNQISKCFICHRNGIFALKYWTNDCYDGMFEAFQGFSKIELWNTFSRQFCMDILVANYLLENDMKDKEYLNGYYWLINIGDLQLDRILENGIAENHMHVNAGTYFSTIWEEMLNLSNVDLDNIPVLREYGSIQYKDYIVKASIFRIISSYYLRSRIHSGKLFYDYLETLDASLTECKKIIDLMNCNKLVIDVIDFKDVYDKLLRGSSVGEILGNGKSYIHTTDENIFLFESLKYIKTTKDDVFSRLFWKYIVLKNILYQGITQNNYSTGLDYFQKYFSKATCKLNVGRHDYLKNVFLNQIYNNHLKKLEIRISPPNNPKQKNVLRKQLCKSLKDIFEVYLELIDDKNISDIVPNLGIVIHFIKEKDQTFFEKCWCIESDKDSNYFYGNIQRRYFNQINTILDIRKNIPNLSKYLVGIDAASVENNTEPWVFAPIYQVARDSKNGMLDNKFSKINNLGFTFHVGEEFRHIVSGLRHIDEVIEHFGYHAGDRIGHGIALGIDISSWCENNKIIAIPRIEYLENLLWLWGISKECGIDFNYVEQEIMKLAECIYENIQGITVYELWKAYQAKFNKFQVDEDLMNSICNIQAERCAEKILCTKVSTTAGLYWNAEKLLHAFHCKCYLERMYEVIQVNVVKSDVEYISCVQSYLKKRLNQKGIVVEVNPTSNLAISDIERLFKHHAIRLNDKGLDGNSKENGLILNINSDDPVVFNTSTSNELAYIFYLLQDKGYSRESILSWIDKVRKWGMDTSFVIADENRTKEDRRKEIEQIINALK